jgi:hypothetical protein
MLLTKCALASDTDFHDILVVDSGLSAVMRGLDPRNPLREERNSPKRDGRDKPGHDEQVDLREQDIQLRMRWIL